MATKKFVNEYPASNGLLIGIIETTRKKKPVGLRSPYEYVLPAKDAIEGCDKLVEMLSRIERENPGLRYCGARKSSCSRRSFKGLRLSIFILGQGLKANSNLGVSRAFWRGLVKDVQKELQSFLGPDAEVYAEPYVKNDGFQIRFDTAILMN
jgi:hypothetical protein